MNYKIRVQVLFIILCFGGVLHAQSCLDTLMARSSFMGIVPAADFYLDSSFWYSEAYSENIERKYYWRGRTLDSIYQNGELSWQLVSDESLLPATGRANILKFHTSGDTAFHTLNYYKNGVLLSTQVVEKRWMNGFEIDYLEEDEGRLQSKGTRVLLVEDTLKMYSVNNEQPILQNYTVKNSFGECECFDTTRTLTETIKYIVTANGFTEISQEVGSVYADSHYFKSFKPSVVKSKFRNNYSDPIKNQLYNLKGQKIKHRLAL